MGNAFVDGVLSIFEYDTVKTVHIRSKKVGLMFRLLQAAILLYVVLYSIVMQKGYQMVDIPSGSILTKVKGFGYTNQSGSISVWDPTDYVIPAQEEDALFILTNYLLTPNQTRGEWLEDPAFVTNCTSNKMCPYLKSSRSGLLSGTCDLPSQGCTVLGWGPVELSARDSETQIVGNPSQLARENVLNFTIMVKNNIFFSKFGTKFINVGATVNLTTCHWDPNSANDCPIMYLRQVLALSGETDFTNNGSQGNPLVVGGVFMVKLTYNCDLDKSHTCLPKYGFQRIDTSSQWGYNFRFGYYSTDSVTKRDLYKAYGTRLVFVVSGHAGKFSIVPLLISLGSGLGLLSVATIIADLAVTKCLKRRQFYYEKKYEIVNDPDAITSVAPAPLNSGDDEAKPLLRM
eukprot:m.133512 g.133512  ORF g.133512 m.133512 type:complete len:401 (+) comp16513_c0_seq1:195-1397(+)